MERSRLRLGFWFARVTSEIREVLLACSTESAPIGAGDRGPVARRRREVAESLYQQLRAQFPESAVALFVIVARLRLDAGDPDSALAGFNTYLSTSDQALREQAMAGRALAWKRLDEPERERHCWVALLAAYPRSAYAALALRRLRATST